MDILQDMFPEHSPATLQKVLKQGGMDFDRAIDILLSGEYEDEQRNGERIRTEKRKVKGKELSLPTKHERRIPPPPLLSPASSADSFKQLRISDDGDGNGGDEDSDIEFAHASRRRRSPRSPAGADHAAENNKSPRISEDECLAGVLAVFPDACPMHIKTLYKENYSLHPATIVEFLADKLVEDGYPRVDTRRAGNKRKREPEDDGMKLESAQYEAVDRDPPSQEYINHARKLLQQEFPLVPATHIGKVLSQNNFFLVKAYPIIAANEREYDSLENSPYKRLLSTRKIDNGRWKVGKAWNEISSELEYARNKVRREELQRQSESDAALAAQINEKEHEESNMLVECGCCFGDYPFDYMTHCNETHFFCVDCARRNAENEVGNGRYVLRCMHSSGCKAEFPRREVLRFLDDKTIAALAKIQQEEDLRNAMIDGLVSCPFCDYAAICPPIEEDKEFECQNPECETISCRHCRQKSHIPLTCEEYAKDNKMSVRHAVEEAMTEALLRKCNKCASPFIKESGCNRIHCQRCGSVQCYVCSQTIQGYDHFDDVRRGGKANNCPLFDNTEARHETEVQTAAAKAVNKLQEENPDLDKADLEIQLSEEVRKAEAARLARAAEQHSRANGHRVVPPGMHPPQALIPVLPGHHIQGLGQPHGGVGGAVRRIFRGRLGGGREPQIARVEEQLVQMQDRAQAHLPQPYQHQHQQPPPAQPPLVPPLPQQYQHQAMNLNVNMDVNRQPFFQVIQPPMGMQHQIPLQRGIQNVPPPGMGIVGNNGIMPNGNGQMENQGPRPGRMLQRGMRVLPQPQRKR